VGSSDEDHDLPSVHDGSNPDGQGLLGNLRQVSIEEPGIGLDRVLVKKSFKNHQYICKRYVKEKVKRKLQLKPFHFNQVKKE
jgi:hypothetical protein